MTKDNIVWFSHNESDAKDGKEISALIDIRLTLMLKKLTSDTILRSELQEIVTQAKQKTQDLEVKMVLDEVFDECFKDNVMRVDDVQQTVEQKIDKYPSGDGETKGTALIKRNHYKGSEASSETYNVDVKPVA